MSAEDPRYGVITGGTWCADHNKLVETWPNEDELTLILQEEIRGGGSACNLGIDIKRLDPNLPVATIGLLGDDSDGHLLKDQAQAEGLDHAALAMVDGQRTTFTDAFTSSDSGRRTHLFHPGTSSALTPQHFHFSASRAKILHLGLPGLHAKMDAPWENDQNGWVTVLKSARSQGLKTNLELCSLPAQQLHDLIVPCLAHLDYLIVNEYEIAAVAGNPVSHEQESDIAACLLNAEQVLKLGSMELVIVHFPMGAVVLPRNGAPITSPSVNLPAELVVGTNGAGDAFAAGALYGLHEGWDLGRTLELAHASAAASMRHIGTTDAVVGWQECLSLTKQHGWREPLN